MEDTMTLCFWGDFVRYCTKAFQGGAFRVVNGDNLDTVATLKEFTGDASRISSPVEPSLDSRTSIILSLRRKEPVYIQDPDHPDHAGKTLILSPPRPA